MTLFTRLLHAGITEQLTAYDRRQTKVFNSCNLAGMLIALLRLAYLSFGSPNHYPGFVLFVNALPLFSLWVNAHLHVPAILPDGYRYFLSLLSGCAGSDGVADRGQGIGGLSFSLSFLCILFPASPMAHHIGVLLGHVVYHRRSLFPAILLARPIVQA